MISSQLRKFVENANATGLLSGSTALASLFKVVPSTADPSLMPNWTFGWNNGNIIDPAIHSSAILSSGYTETTFRNIIGDFATINGETGYGPYPNPVAGASYSCIIGGYDNGVAAQAGIVAGQHNRIHAACNHGMIYGVSCILKSGQYGTALGKSNTIGDGTNDRLYGTISGGFNHTVLASGSTIAGGEHNQILHVDTSHSAISGGLDNTISASGISNSISGGRSNTITGTSQYAIINGGQNNTITNGDYSLAAGQNNNISGPYAIALGNGNNITAQFGVATGELNTVSAIDAKCFGSGVTAWIPGAIFHGSRELAGAGIAAFTWDCGEKTTDATATNLSGRGAGAFGTMPANSAMAGNIYLIGRQESTNNIVAYQCDFNAYKAASGTNVVVPSQTWSLIGADGIGIAGAPAIASATTQTFRIAVQGKAATTIVWSAVVTAAIVTGV